MRDVLAAFVAALDAASVAPVYKAGQVPNSPPAGYTVVSATVPRASDYTQAARSGSRAWRFVTLYVGTSMDSCLFRAEEAESALLDQRLTVAGQECSPIKREAGRPIAPDPNVEGMSSGADSWTFTTTNA